MSEYEIDVRTNKDLGTDTFVRDLLSAWCTELDERIRPQFFDVGEPVRRSFEGEGVEAAIRTWVDGGMPLMLRRKDAPRFTVDINWRGHRGIDQRLFPWSCTVWLASGAGDKLAVQLLRFLIDHFEPAYGHCSTYDEHRSKHFVVYKDGAAQAEQYVGLDVGETLPGVYWVTYFGSWAIDKIGRTPFEDLAAHKVERIGEGYLVSAYSSAKEAGSARAREAEDRIIQHLGRKLFFDKRLIDLDALKTDPKTSALVQAKLEEIKAKKGKDP